MVRVWLDEGLGVPVFLKTQYTVFSSDNCKPLVIPHLIAEFTFLYMQITNEPRS